MLLNNNENMLLYRINLGFSVLVISKRNEKGRREGIVLVFLAFWARISEFFNLRILPFSHVHDSNHCI